MLGLLFTFVELLVSYLWMSLVWFDMLISLVCQMMLPNSAVSAMVVFSCFSRQVSLPADQPFACAWWDVLSNLTDQFLALWLILCTSRLLHMPFHNGNNVNLPCVSLCLVSRSSSNHIIGHWWPVQRWTYEGVFEEFQSDATMGALTCKYQFYLVDVQATPLFKSAPGRCVVPSLKNT